MHYVSHYLSPLGKITLAADEKALTGLWFDGQKYFGDHLDEDSVAKETPIIIEVKSWLDTYFAGRQPDFTPALRFVGSPFQKQVWELLEAIPYGQTMTYGELACLIAREKDQLRTSARAVGGAVGRNPISIIVPCHRVVGRGGKLTGYAGGLEKKVALLKLEGVKI